MPLDLRIGSRVAGSVVDNHRFAKTGHPANHALAHLTVEPGYLVVAGAQEADFHIGAIMVDPEDQGRLGIDRRHHQPQHLLNQFLVVERRVEPPSRFQK